MSISQVISDARFFLSFSAESRPAEEDMDGDAGEAGPETVPGREITDETPVEEAKAVPLPVETEEGAVEGLVATEDDENSDGSSDDSGSSSSGSGSDSSSSESENEDEGGPSAERVDCENPAAPPSAEADQQDPGKVFLRQVCVCGVNAF